VKKQLKSDVEIMVDTGIMHGSDVIASVAQGASFTLIGRAYLYGLMAGGREGVDRALQILSGQMARTMKLLGVKSLKELQPEHVKILKRFVSQ
jgi:L-lactate dehydrogenase (cytochrome)